MFPALSVVNPVAPQTPAEIAGPPSPPKLHIPTPAIVVMMPCARAGVQASAQTVRKRRSLIGMTGNPSLAGRRRRGISARRCGPGGPPDACELLKPYRDKRDKRTRKNIMLSQSFGCQYVESKQGFSKRLGRPCPVV